MNKGELDRIVRCFEKTLNALNDAKIVRKRNIGGIRAGYAEYMVALKLQEEYNCEVQIGKPKKPKTKGNYDLYLPETEKFDGVRVEVKSGMEVQLSCDKETRDGIATASFGNGGQIKDEKFDICAFVVFEQGHAGSIREILWFDLSELEDVEIPRPDNARYNTNACLLYRCRKYEDYKWVVSNKLRFKIEKKLHKHPEKYRNRKGLRRVMNEYKK